MMPVKKKAMGTRFETPSDGFLATVALWILITFMGVSEVPAAEETSAKAASIETTRSTTKRKRTHVAKHSNAHRREPSADTAVVKEREDEKELRNRLQNVEQSVEKIESELEVLKAEARLMIQANRLGFQDQFYARAGLVLIIPRARTFTFDTDTGLGAFVGIGHYFGRNHVLDLGFEWDLYPALSLDYRYEVHGDNSGLTWGPVLGFKTKAAPVRPFDNFLADPDAVQNSFVYFGAILGFPMNQSMLTVQLLYLVNTQAFLVTNCGVHFFL